MPTNAEILQRITALEGRMDGYEKRMDVYDRLQLDNANQLTANSKVLADIKHGTDFLKGSFRAVKWAGGLIMAAALWQVGTVLYHLLFH